MKETITQWVGIDVHKETLVAHVLEGQAAEGEEFRIGNSLKEVQRLFRRLMKRGELRCCYEAGPCGYELKRQLAKLKINCEVIAPAFIPRSQRDKVKTDSRDALKLARYFRNGDLTLIRVPDEREEAARGLVRLRMQLLEDKIRFQQRMGKFLMLHGRRWPGKNWSKMHFQWLRKQEFEQTAAQRTFREYLDGLDHSLERLSEATREVVELAQDEAWRPLIVKLCGLRGIDTVAAMTLAVEIVDFRRFSSPRQLMSFLGLTPSLYASGQTSHQGSITKNGNRHARRILLQAAWNNRFRPNYTGTVGKRIKELPPALQEHAKKAQRRLSSKFVRLNLRGKQSQVTATAVARELVGFVWALAVMDDKGQVPGRRCDSTS